MKFKAVSLFVFVGIFSRNNAMQPIQDLRQMFIQSLHENIPAPSARYERTLSTLADSFDGVSSMLSVVGNHKAARQVTVIGQAGIKLIESCHALTMGAAMASPIAPFAGIASAASLIFSLFNDDPDPLGVLSQQIQTVDEHVIDGFAQTNDNIIAMHQALTEQIGVVFRYMMEHFDGLENQVDKLQLHLVQGFLNMSQQMRDFTAASQYSFDRITSELQILHGIETRVDALLLRPVIQSAMAIEQFPNGFGDLANQASAVTSHFQVLKNSLLGVDPAHQLFNGCLSSDFSPITINRILTSSSPAALLGYLARYKESVLGLPNPPTIDVQKLPHLGIFTLCLERYLKLLKRAIHLPYETQDQALHEIACVGDNALTFINSIQENRNLFERLFENYKASRLKASTLEVEAFEKRSQELLESVHTKAVEANQTKLAASFPADYYQGMVVTNGTHAYHSVHESLAHQHAETKKAFEYLLTRFINNKAVFKIPLGGFDEHLALNAGLLSPLVLANNSECRMPLHVKLNKALLIEKNIPKEAIIAERLGLGLIELKYNWSQGNPIVIYADFKKNDNSVLPIGMAVIASGESDNEYLKKIKPLVDLMSNSIFCDATDAKLANREIQMLKLLLNWGHAPTATWTIEATSVAALSSLNATRLAELRKEAIAILLAHTELASRHQIALDEMDAPYNALQAFGSIVGMRQEDFRWFANLPTKEKVLTSLKRYCASTPLDKDNPSFSLSSFLLLMPPAGIFDRLSQAQRENEFSRPLRILMAKLGHFAVIHPEIVRLRQEELARRAQAAQRTATERETALMQEVAGLRGTVTTLSERIEAMTLIMQQLLAQRAQQ